MAIEKKYLNGYSPVIYVGGGNFFTQAKPTNFHQFWTQKILLANETITDFKEVTAAERSAIEAADAEWTRPPQSFIDGWNNACVGPRTKLAVGQYNESSGYFELNGIVDIGYEEAMKIYRFSHTNLSAKYTFGTKYNGDVNIQKYCYCRTYLPILWPSYSGNDMTDAFSYNRVVQVISFEGGYGTVMGANVILKGTFRNCNALREILCEIRNPELDLYSFYGCTALETLRLTVNTGQTMPDLRWSPALTYDSFQWLVTHATTSAENKAYTVTVHADVFAKLTGDTSNEAAAALTAEELAAWQQILTAATAKNISFTAP